MLNGGVDGTVVNGFDGNGADLFSFADNFTDHDLGSQALQINGDNAAVNAEISDGPAEHSMSRANAADFMSSWGRPDAAVAADAVDITVGDQADGTISDGKPNMKVMTNGSGITQGVVGDAGIPNAD